MEAGKPAIFVSMNYRLGVLGFGNGREIAENGAANLGIRDIIAALEWVKANVWAFGGDVSKVAERFSSHFIQKHGQKHGFTPRLIPVLP